MGYYFASLIYTSVQCMLGATEIWCDLEGNMLHALTELQFEHSHFLRVTM